MNASPASRRTASRSRTSPTVRPRTVTSTCGSPISTTAPGGRVRRTRLTRVRGVEASPSWAPDGSRIAFAGVRDGVARRVRSPPSIRAARPVDGPVLVSRTRRNPGVVARWPADCHRRSAAVRARLQRQPASQSGRSAAALRAKPTGCGSSMRRCLSTRAREPSHCPGCRPPGIRRPSIASGRRCAGFITERAGGGGVGGAEGQISPRGRRCERRGQLETVVDRMIAEQPLIKPAVTSARAVVVSGHPLASRAGTEALERGGNIVDAAIAVSFALGVVEPDASGIGGDGMAVLYLKGMSEPVAIDYKDQAPGPRHARQPAASARQRRRRLGCEHPGCGCRPRLPVPHVREQEDHLGRSDRAGHPSRGRGLHAG